MTQTPCVRHLHIGHAFAMPRYVVLHHVLPPGGERRSHWDFMLEFDRVLWTWALEQAPDRANPIVAERLPDHRLHYLDYEGPVSGDRGHVTRWDSGTFEFHELGGCADRVRLAIAGARLKGTVELTRDLNAWQFAYREA